MSSAHAESPSMVHLHISFVLFDVVELRERQCELCPSERGAAGCTKACNNLQADVARGYRENVYFYG